MHAHGHTPAISAILSAHWLSEEGTSSYFPTTTAAATSFQRLPSPSSALVHYPSYLKLHTWGQDHCVHARVETLTVPRQLCYTLLVQRLAHCPSTKVPRLQQGHQGPLTASNRLACTHHVVPHVVPCSEPAWCANAIARELQPCLMISASHADSASLLALVDVIPHSTSYRFLAVVWGFRHCLFGPDHPFRGLTVRYVAPVQFSPYQDCPAQLLKFTLLCSAVHLTQHAGRRVTPGHSARSKRKLPKKLRGTFMHPMHAFQ